MLGGLLFSFWRIFEIVTLIPIIGMLVYQNPAPHDKTLTNYSPIGLVRFRLQFAKPPHSILHSRPLHRFHPCLRLGYRDPHPPRLHPPLCLVCRLHRPLLRWRLHRSRLRAPRHRQSRLHKFHYIANLRQSRAFRLLWRQ